ncbi:hypothetical protein DFP92_11835 [Yoonia sediminilitoris]|uniref:Uncharacterized protein n=1 Tax=Yoonia sediminilitoris TaxID=1286148 RepID=A0A2T6K7B0_9RHOB|nr:hypothetical protein C8N45_1189 [Yoonia sediminilitoris]RCW90090.1 hypothetical protein DFP92_11835 [Yoonia sediminilitoris]
MLKPLLCPILYDDGQSRHTSMPLERQNTPLEIDFGGTIGGTDRYPKIFYV